MLYDRQGVVDVLIYRPMPDDAYDSALKSVSCFGPSIELFSFSAFQLFYSDLTQSEKSNPKVSQ